MKIKTLKNTLYMAALCAGVTSVFAAPNPKVTLVAADVVPEFGLALEGTWDPEISVRISGRELFCETAEVIGPYIYQDRLECGLEENSVLANIMAGDGDGGSATLRVELYYDNNGKAYDNEDLLIGELASTKPPQTLAEMDVTFTPAEDPIVEPEDHSYSWVVVETVGTNVLCSDNEQTIPDGYEVVATGGGAFCNVEDDELSDILVLVNSGPVGGGDIEPAIGWHAACTNPYSTIIEVVQPLEVYANCRQQKVGNVQP